MGEQEVAFLRQQLEVAEQHARDRLRLRHKRGPVADVAKRDADDFRAPEVLEQDHLELTAEVSEAANAADVSADVDVRVAKAAFQAVLLRGPLDEVQLDHEFSFVAHRPQKVYAAEIRTLLTVVEAGIKELALRTRQQLWAQSVLRALDRGVAMHIDEEGYDWINFAVDAVSSRPCASSPCWRGAGLWCKPALQDGCGVRLGHSWSQAEAVCRSSRS